MEYGRVRRGADGLLPGTPARGVSGVIVVVVSAGNEDRKNRDNERNSKFDPPTENERQGRENRGVTGGDRLHRSGMEVPEDEDAQNHEDEYTHDYLADDPGNDAGGRPSASTAAISPNPTAYEEIIEELSDHMTYSLGVNIGVPSPTHRDGPAVRTCDSPARGV